MPRGRPILVALVCLAVFAGAQGAVYVPDSNPATGTCNAWPFNVYKDWRYQCIIEKKYLPSAPFKLVDLGFAPCSSGTWTALQFQVRINHTTLSNFNVAPKPNCFDTMLGPCPTVAYNGPLTWKPTMNTWSPLGLQCPFGYDGKRNIVIEIRYRGRGSFGTSCHRSSTVPRAYTHNGYSKDPYNAPCWHIPIPGQFMALKMELKIDRRNVLVAADTVKVGQTAVIQILAAPPGKFYRMAASFGQYPGFNLGSWKICLVPDNLFILSLVVGPPLFLGYTGVVGAGGQAAGQLKVPNIPALAGLCVYHAAVIFDQSGIVGATNSDGTKIVP